VSVTTTKGAFGIRVDAADDVVINNVEIDTVANVGHPVSTSCFRGNDTPLKLNGGQTQNWYTGTDAVGVSIAGSTDVMFSGHNIVRNVMSAAGNVYGVKLVHMSDSVMGQMTVGSLTTLLASNSITDQTPEQIYAVRPNVREGGGVPQAQSVQVDVDACNVGGGARLLTVNGINTMSCDVEAHAPPYDVEPVPTKHVSSADYDHTCPAGFWGEPPAYTQVSTHTHTHHTHARTHHTRTRARAHTHTHTNTHTTTWLVLCTPLHYVFHHSRLHLYIVSPTPSTL
jgi:hypothetical protein